MKAHYKSEAEWLADFAAMMAARESGAERPALTHSKAIPIRPSSIALERTKPAPIKRTP